MYDHTATMTVRSDTHDAPSFTLQSAIPALASLVGHCRVCRPARQGLVRIAEGVEAVYGFTSKRFVTTVTAISLFAALLCFFA